MGGKTSDIINAASEVFLKKGFAAAGVDEIAAVANVSKRTLYKHFGSKEKLLGAIVVQTSGQLHNSLDLSTRNGTNPGQALWELADNYVRLILSPESLNVYRLVISESARFPELARAFHENGAIRLREHLASNLIGWQAAGLVSVEDPEIAADQFFGACAGSLRLRALFEADDTAAFPPSIDAWVEAAVARFLASIGYHGDRGRSRVLVSDTLEGVARPIVAIDPES